MVEVEVKHFLICLFIINGLMHFIENHYCLMVLQGPRGEKGSKGDAVSILFVGDN